MRATTQAAWHEEMRRVEATVWAWQHFCAPSPRRDARLRETLRAWALLMAHAQRLGTGRPEPWGGR